MKKVTAIVLALVMVLGLASCGQTGNTNNANTAANNTSNASNAGANNAAPAGNNAAPAANTSNSNNAAQEEIKTGPGKVLSNGYVVPEGKLVTMSAKSEKKYIYNMTNLFLIPGYDVAYMDQFEFDLSLAAQEADGDVYVALSDLAKIYGPDFSVNAGNDGIEIKHAGLSATIKDSSAEVKATNGTFTMKNPVKTVSGEVCVPAAEFLECAFGKCISSQAATGWNTEDQADGKYEFDKYKSTDFTIYMISNGKADINDKEAVPNATINVMKNKLRGAKNYGIVFKAFYDERVDKCITTELYVPTTAYFNPADKYKCIVLFPGANGSADSYNSTSTQNITQNFQPYAEEYGYVLVTVESWIMSGQYGDPTGPIGRFPVTNPENKDNPWNKSQGWLEDIVTSGDVVIDTLEYAASIAPIDMNRVAAVGVSMGSMGAFSMGVNYHDRFKALVGTAGITEIDYWDVSKVGDLPFLFIGGTEDVNGLDFLLYGIDKLSKLLPNFEYKLTGGASHGTEWRFYADDIFKWLDSKIK